MVKLDHATLKFDLYRVAATNASIDTERLGNHHICRLGEWYYHGEGQHCFSALKEYKAIEAPHQAFHNLAGCILGKISAGEGSDLLPDFKALESASMTLLATLNQLADADAAMESLLCSTSA